MDAHVTDIETARGFSAEKGVGAVASRLEKDFHAKDGKAYRLAVEADAENTVEREALEKYLGDVKSRLGSKGVELKYTYHEESGDLQVELINTENEKIMRKIPPDELLKLASSLKEMAGKLVNRSV